MISLTNPSLFANTPVLAEMRHLRQELCLLWSLLARCSQKTCQSLVSLLARQTYLLGGINSIDTYSLSVRPCLTPTYTDLVPFFLSAVVTVYAIAGPLGYDFGLERKRAVRGSLHGTTLLKRRSTKGTMVVVVESKVIEGLTNVRESQPPNSWMRYNDGWRLLLPAGFAHELVPSFDVVNPCTNQSRRLKKFN